MPSRIRQAGWDSSNSPLSAPNMLVNSLICQTFSVDYMSGTRNAKIKRHCPKSQSVTVLKGKIDGHIDVPSKKKELLKQKKSVWGCREKATLLFLLGKGFQTKA